MRRSRQVVFSLLVATVVVAADAVWAADDARLERLKKEVAAEIEELADLSQQMNDVVFSFAELGFQEVETSRYLTGILRKNGFVVREAPPSTSCGAAAIRAAG